VDEVRVGVLLDLVIHDYQESGQKTLPDVKRKIENALRPFFGEMLAYQVDSVQIEFKDWRCSQASQIEQARL
jgi:hypothetical protein